jgi:hypothetical protein
MAFMRTLALASGVDGPVLLCALRRFADICLSVAILFEAPDYRNNMADFSWWVKLFIFNTTFL